MGGCFGAYSSNSDEPRPFTRFAMQFRSVSADEWGMMATLDVTTVPATGLMDPNGAAGTGLSRPPQGSLPTARDTIPGNEPERRIRMTRFCLGQLAAASREEEGGPGGPPSCYADTAGCMYSTILP
jgi:hypothetical protein